MHPAPRHRPTLLAATIAAALLGLAHDDATAQNTAPANPGRATDAVHTYDIAPGSLGETLVAIAQQSGRTISVDPVLVQGLQAPAVRGSFTLEQAAQRALEGHALLLVRTGSGTLTVHRSSPAAGGFAPAQQGHTLTEVRVTAQPEHSGTTEGTGSYAARGPHNAATPLGLTLKETPQSVSVITRQQLDDQALQSVSEILHNAPGITVTQLDSERYDFYSRGFGIDNFQYDGVPTTYSTATGDSELDPVLYDRVEIVRGATGLLTGAGDPSAAINLVRKRADSHVFTGSLSASAASWDNYRASADLAAPLTQDGRIRGRLVVAEESKKSYIDNYSRERRTLYATVAADLTPATTLNAGASYERGRVTGVTYGGFPLVHSDGSAIDWRNRGRSFSIWPRWTKQDTDNTSAFAELQHTWNNGWKTTVLAMYSHQEFETARLFPWGFPDPQTGLMSSSPSRVKFPGERTQRSVDVRSQGTFDAFGRSHEAAVGLSQSHQEYTLDRIGAADTVPSVNFFDWANYPEPTAWGTSVKSETYDRTQTGTYGALRLSLADPLKLIVGGRFNRWERKGAGYMGRNAYDYRHSKFTPYAGLIYELGRNYALYGSYTSIYKPQNYQDRHGSFLDPAEGHNWETGVKGEFLGGRVQASAAVFRIQQDNVATADIGQTVPGTTTLAYVGTRGVVSKGVEFELNGELRPGWNLAFNAAHFKATNAKGDDVSTASPRTVLRLSTTYRLSGDWKRLTVGGGANWQSATTNPTGVYHYDNPNGVGSYRQGAYPLASLMARYQFTPQLSLQLNIDNLFDKWYYTSVNFNEQVIWGAPRSYRATMTYKF